MTLHQTGEAGKGTRPLSWPSRKEAGGAWCSLCEALCQGLNALCGGYSFTLDFLACQALS